ncbi:M14 family metallopeptidase [Prosthecochloris sp. GSB1]|uniref:M14 family metallopeptidase n=1 Tax=Prosthecochloris sp. GSB1 TaxID=281093 RepID=UPI001F35334D|nr:M14 family metallopeptidase [Prosthecochloris sp. GSB1]
MNDNRPEPRLSCYNGIPEGFADAKPSEIASVLPGPAIMHIEGERNPPLFVSALLHGNETTGLLALQELIRTLGLPVRRPPRSMVIFIGNIAATAKGVRRLEGEPDYNRIWNGGGMPEHRLARRVLDRVAAARPFAAIDIHNNTGKNPHYACINSTKPSFVHLARRFGKTIVYFTEPHEVISMALSRLCPSVTLECGRSGQSRGTSHVVDYLLHCLTMDPEELFSPPCNPHNKIYHTIAKIVVADDADLVFDDRMQGADICFREDIEGLNFVPLAPGTPLGHVHGNRLPLKIVDNDGMDMTDRYLRVENGRIVTVEPAVPSMFTRDTAVIRQDCFGYLMEPYPPGRSSR